MNKWLYFVCGLVAGIILTLVTVKLFVPAEESHENTEPIVEKEEDPAPESDDDDRIHYFDEPGDVVECKSFKVFQVLAKDAALTHSNSEYDLYMGPICLIVNNNDEYYYDDQIVKVPKGKVARQVGIYRYVTRNDMLKTVPIIMIMDK
jgi:hypothetical protein